MRTQFRRPAAEPCVVACGLRGPDAADLHRLTAFRRLETSPSAPTRSASDRVRTAAARRSEKVVRHILPALKKAGASGIVEYPLNKLVLKTRP